MPLVHNTVYTIRNTQTQTVLDFAGPDGNGDVFALGWGWHGRTNQQWKLFQVNQANHTWRLQNQRVDTDRRFLARQANQAHRLVGSNAEAPHAESTFVIHRIPGSSEKYKIFIANDGPVVTLDTGENVGFAPGDRVHDLQADGPPLAIRDAGGAVASTWSFLPVAQLPLEDGTYRIINSQTGTALDLQSGDANAPAQGRTSVAAAEQQWLVTKDPNGDGYTFKSFRNNDANRFLAPSADAADATLRGQVATQSFTVRKVPGEQLYKIFFGRFAVNLEIQGDGNANPADGTAVRLRAAQAQMWSFS